MGASAIYTPMTGSLSVQRILEDFLASNWPDNVQPTRLMPKPMALEGFKRRVLGSIGVLKGKRKIDEETVKDLSKSLRRALLEADFNVRQAKELTERVERGMVDEEPRPGVKLETHAMHLIYSELVRILGQPREIKPHCQTSRLVEKKPWCKGLGYRGRCASSRCIRAIESDARRDGCRSIRGARV